MYWSTNKSSILYKSTNSMFLRCIVLMEFIRPIPIGTGHCTKTDVHQGHGDHHASLVMQCNVHANVAVLCYLVFNRWLPIKKCTIPDDPWSQSCQHGEIKTKTNQIIFSKSRLARDLRLFVDCKLCRCYKRIETAVFSSQCADCSLYW